MIRMNAIPAGTEATVTVTRMSGSEGIVVTPSNRKGDPTRATGGIVISNSQPTAAVARDAKTAVDQAMTDMPTNAAHVPAAPERK